MESPTLEISHDLEALKLAGHLERQIDNSASSGLSTRERDGTGYPLNENSGNSEQFQAQSRVLSHRLKTDSQNLSDPLNGGLRSSYACSDQPRCDIFPLHSAASSCCVQESRSEFIPPQTSASSSSQSFKNCPNVSLRRENSISFIESFNTLSVSNSTSSQASLPQWRSCREEAVASMNCLDDTTVDDLAGYLDEIMFLPKPMSEMAELMYT